MLLHTSAFSCMASVLFRSQCEAEIQRPLAIVTIARPCELQMYVSFALAAVLHFLQTSMNVLCTWARPLFTEAELWCTVQLPCACL